MWLGAAMSPAAKAALTGISAGVGICGAGGGDKMARLIDADKLHFSPRFAWTTPDREEMVPVLAVDKKWVDKAPTVDAVEVVHGRWEEHLEFDFEGRCNGSISSCTACGELFSYIDTEDYNYCPNCGAKMDMEVKDV